MIKHSKVDSAPPSSNSAKIDSTAWNDNHIITDPAAVSAALGIHVVSGDPNGILAAEVGELARDTSGQLWQNTSGGATWIPFLRADGVTVNSPTFFFTYGDSNDYGHATSGTSDIEWQVTTITSQDTQVLFNSMSAPAASDPIALTEDVPNGPLRKHATDGSGFDYGIELSLGRTLVQTIGNICLIKFAVSGATIDKYRPSSTHRPSGMGGKNYYEFLRDRALSFAGVSGRKLGGVIGIGGGNDGNDATLADQVAAALTEIFGQLRTDFGPQVAGVWARTHTGIGVPFYSTVIARQQAAALTIPNFRLVGIDDAQLNVDTVHYLSRGYWTLGQRLAFAMLDMRGYPRFAVTANPPQLVGYGTAAYGAGSVAPVSWPGTQPDDMMYMVAVSEMGSSSAITTPSGWTAVVGGTGVPVSSSGSGFVCNLALFRRAVSQADLDANDGHTVPVTVTMPGTENAAQIFTVRGNGSIITDASAHFESNAFNASTFNATGVTPAVPDSGIFVFCGGFTGATVTIGAVNAGIAELTKVKDGTYLCNSNDQSIAVFAGMASSATGTTAITPSGSVVGWAMTIAVHA